VLLMPRSIRSRVLFLERMGDRIQNICERTVYEVTGVMHEFSGRGHPHA